MSRPGLLQAGIGLVMLTVHLPWVGTDLTPDLVALVLIVLAGRALGSRTLVVAGVLAVPVQLIGAGGLLNVVQPGGYGWWYAIAAATLVLEAVIALRVLALVLRTRPGSGWWRRWVPPVTIGYGAAVVAAAVLLVVAEPGAYVAGTGLAVLVPLIDLAQLMLGIGTLLVAERCGTPKGAPAAAGTPFG